MCSPVEILVSFIIAQDLVPALLVRVCTGGNTGVIRYVETR